MKRVGQEPDVVERDVAFSALDRADVGAIQPCCVRELFLAPASLVAQDTNAGAERGAASRGEIVTGRHGVHTRRSDDYKATDYE